MPQLYRFKVMQLTLITAQFVYLIVSSYQVKTHKMEEVVKANVKCSLVRVSEGIHIT